jgi:glycosyltransferase involved in cell wall biosynthesis
MLHAQQIARALYEANALEAFATSVHVSRTGLVAGLVSNIFGESVMRELRRRSIDEVPESKIRTYPLWELFRILASRADLGPVVADRLWHRGSLAFDARVAHDFVHRVSAAHAFEYTAFATFERAHAHGVAKILHLPSLDSRHFEHIRRVEMQKWPKLASVGDGYFASKFEERYARRQAEIALADVIVVNSTLTARSHVVAGADPRKIHVATLGAPPPIAEPILHKTRREQRLQVVCAGNFSLGKGAHYLIAAWRKLIARAGESAAQLHVFGAVQLPREMMTNLDCIAFHGSAPRSVLFDAFLAADVLVFPTLSDGFGMVVAEALAHGLPVITTDQAGAADLVTPQCGWVGPACDASFLFETLLWCLDNREALQGMRFAALEAARGRQWSDFRHDVIARTNAGLRRAGFSVSEDAA